MIRQDPELLETVGGRSDVQNAGEEQKHKLLCVPSFLLVSGEFKHEEEAFNGICAYMGCGYRQDGRPAATVPEK